MFLKISIKNKKEIKKIKTSGYLASNWLDYLRSIIKVGTNLLELEELTEKFLKDNNLKSAFKNYQDFPNYLCISLNNALVHGIPYDYLLNDGDLISIDFGIKYKGYFSDCAISFVVGESNELKDNLLEGTYNALNNAVEYCKPGCYTGDLGAIISQTASEYNLEVIKSVYGHGIGVRLHEEPDVANSGIKGQGVRLEKNMTLAIEPIFSLKPKEKNSFFTSNSYLGNDNWTLYTIDGSLGAHFEYTILIDKKPEILTPWKKPF